MKSYIKRRSVDDMMIPFNGKKFVSISRSISHDSLLFKNTDYYPYDVSEVWRNDFQKLVSTITDHSENLESLSTELLKTEGKVRQLIVLQRAISEQFDQREDQYYQKLTECQQAAKQQLALIENLMELGQDLEMTTQNNNNNNNNKNKSEQDRQHRQDSECVRNTSDRRRASNISNSSTVNSHQWQVGNTIQDLIGLKSLEDALNTLRWEVGLWIGGGVGTGHVIHSFENPNRGVEMMVAGSGTLTTTVNSLSSSDSDSNATISQQQQHHHSQQEESNVTPSSIRFIHHQYIFHITPQDRKTKLALLSKKNWIPDHDADSCQLQNHAGSCEIQFSFFQRRHHCRRCGLVICQRHSLNRLPLFSNRHDNVIWHRVCDICFHDAIQ